MLHENIKSRFASRVRLPEFKDIKEADWSSWRWQWQHTQKSVTPFSKGLNSELLAAQHLLHPLKENLFKVKTRADYTEVFFPLISMIPQRVDQDFVLGLKNKGQVIFHFSLNHPSECSLELMEALSTLAENGYILNNHMTLLNGINNQAEIVKDLNLQLLMMRVRPYSIYLYEQRAAESDLFKVSRAEGIAIMESLRGWTSGLAVPHLLAQKEDKTFEAILPNYVKKVDGENFIFRNYKHMDYEYTN